MKLPLLLAIFQLMYENEVCALFTQKGHWRLARKAGAKTLLTFISVKYLAPKVFIELQVICNGIR